MIPAYESLSVIENFFAEPLSKEIIRQIKYMPNYQFEELCARIDLHYQRWYQNRVQAATRRDPSISALPSFMPIYSNVYPYSPEFTLFGPEFEHWLKCSLLYFPGRIEIPDPIGSYSLAVHRLAGHDYRNRRCPANVESRRREILYGLPMLYQLRPLIEAGSVATISVASMDQLSDDSWDLASGELEPEDLASFGPIEIRERLVELEQMQEHVFRVHEYVDLDDDPSLVHPWEVTANWLWMGLCLDNSPVAADSRAATAMERDFEIELSTAVQDQRVGRLVSRFQIPGADNAALDDVVRIRLNEEAFSEFRESFNRILKAVVEVDPGDDYIFSREFERNVHDELASQRTHVAKNARKSDFLRQTLSGVFLLGAAGVEAVVTHGAPVGTLLAGAAGGGGWLIPYLIKRSNEKKTDDLTRMFFSSLVRRTSRERNVN